MPSYIDQLRADIQPSYTDTLYHHGVKGQHWGVRRYRNADGSVTPAGKKHYADEYGTELGSGRKIRQQYKQAKRRALGRLGDADDASDRAWDEANLKTKAAYKAGKISKKERDAQYEANARKAEKAYAKTGAAYDKAVNTAKATMHTNKARMLENRARMSTEASGNNILVRGLNNSRLGRAKTQRLKADIASAKASGDKKAIASAKEALKKNRRRNWAFGDDARAASYDKYRAAGKSRAEAYLRSQTIG